ncbi:unnamed protein product [Symbiodinium sp. CCMP2456]|nr:unnamed protein product [Symbiodinium sp. CCMP2456]
MSFELTAFPLLGIERFLYGYIYQFPESFKRCCKGPLKSLLDYDEGVYWQVAKHLGVGIKVFQFGVLGYDLVLRRSLSLAEPNLLCPDHKGDKLKAGGGDLAFHPLVRPEDELLEAGRWKKPAKEDESKGHLIYLTGARSLLALWILGDHFIHRASVFTDRSNVAVAAFISLSGFVTQWAYSTRDFSRLGTVFQYLVRRIGRVALTTYFAMLAAVGVLAVQTHIPSWRHMVRCFLFVETWLQPENWCPDGQSWTIAALLPSWLIYPSLKHLVGLMEKNYGALGLLQLLLALWMISAGPSLVVFLMQDGFLTNKQHNLAYLWPPSQMPDFAIGVIAATLAKRHDASSAKSGLPPAWLRGLLADLSLIIIFAVVLLVPSSGYHEGWEPLYNHSLGPLWALFFYGSAASQGSGISACTLGVAPLAVLGRYSFEVFLFQQPLFNAFEILWIAGMNEVLPMWGFATIFLVTLYTLSAIYAECIEASAVVQGLLLQCFLSLSHRPSSRECRSGQFSCLPRSSSFSLAEYPENEENISSASIVFWGVFGLLLPLLGGFTTGLIFAALGWGLSTGGILSFVKKTKSIEEYADYVTQVSDLGKKGGEYGLKAYNFVAKKTGEMSK